MSTGNGHTRTAVSSRLDSPRQAAPRHQGAAEAAAQKESYVFSGNINLSRQGTPLPLGYGRLKVGSSVVQASIRSFPLIKPDSESMNANNFVDQTEEGSLVSPITANSISN